jgi:hypothetical protein
LVEYCEKRPMTAASASRRSLRTATEGKSEALSPSESRVRMLPEKSYHEGLMMASSKALLNDVRLLRMKRMLPPNWKVCVPLSHETSSTMLWTGVVRKVVGRKPVGR